MGVGGAVGLGPGKAEGRVLGKKETLGESGKHWEPAIPFVKGRGRGPPRGITRCIPGPNSTSPSRSLTAILQT